VAPSHVGTLAADDSRRTRKVPLRHGGPLRALWTAAHRSTGCRTQIL